MSTIRWRCGRPASITTASGGQAGRTRNFNAVSARPLTGTCGSVSRNLCYINRVTEVLLGRVAAQHAPIFYAASRTERESISCEPGNRGEAPVAPKHRQKIHHEDTKPRSHGDRYNC